MRRWCGQAFSLLAAIGAIGLLGGVFVSCSGENSQPSPSTTTDSIAGVDANANGVRDDVESYIDTTYAGQANADLNKALRQYAKAVRSSMIDADSQPLSLTHATERFRALECLMARRPRDFHTIFVDLRAQVLNTRSRSDAYLKADNQVKAENIPLLPADQWVTACR